MAVAIVTGSAGLIGSETVKFFCDKGFDVVGIDNNFRKTFFGEDASTEWNRQRLEASHKNYTHYDADIRDHEGISKIYGRYGKDIKAVIHCAAQPSHDWAASDPYMDFTVNANGTLVMLENFRAHCPDSVFIFTSTNKVYGDTPNYLPLVELETRWEIDPSHAYNDGIDETMSIDHTKHSLFGASKVAADVLVQEYGRYFGFKTGVFRGGCLTGPSHSGTRLHGFLSYLMRCCITGNKYFIYGYKGKQVRDNIHSYDLVNSLWHFFEKPRVGEVYNMGGGRYSNCSMLEAIHLCEEITGKKLNCEYDETNRIGDHIWWISGLKKFEQHYPDWKMTYDVPRILKEIYETQKDVVETA
ncbi:NAD-dependent epimerase/dehydratase family protein [Solidesulfovibrio magneticus]|uniref:NAD-dependent epimerase/dehydratase family protein n=1 Tax=Solidesulfovibrio magneticus (strain ATCC 700980 / DSM 13731 / RS-1) TaxID=573370 RepID=C4XN02_SOLM1|nr:NAD-dependent epimerase/dehydratase family protein [Solidesulfovibrio magneticus]BAH77305.1 NAD-dependent epimerase/dehydratase family protein [Solidesulfovibrio magneticus RS-1]